LNAVLARLRQRFHTKPSRESYGYVLAFGREEAVEGWFVKLPSGFLSDAEQAQRRSSASFREDEIQGQELGFL
jgi:hypothetical protein